MQSIKFKAKTNANGQLNVQLPLKMADRELDVIVVYQAIEKKESKDINDAADRFYGCLADDPILVAEQTETV